MFFEPPDDSKKSLRFLVGKSGVRFVHNYQRTLVYKRFGNFNKLLLRDRQVFYRFVEIYLDIHAVEHVLGPSPHLLVH